jgi:hypothetical protein
MSEVSDFIQMILGQEWYIIIALAISTLITIANLITMWFPTVKDNAIYNFIMKILNVLALNIKHNRNADEVIKKQENSSDGKAS